VNVRCWIVRRRLDSLASGELRGRRAESIRRHLKVCSSCAEEFDRISSALNALRSVGQDVKWGRAASSESWHGIRERLAVGWHEQPAFRPLPLAAAAFGTILIVIGILVVISPGEESGPEVAHETAKPLPGETFVALPEGIRVPVMQEYTLEAVPVSYEVEWGRF